MSESGHPEPPPPSVLPPDGVLESGLAAAGALRWVALEMTAVLEEARRRHDLAPLAAVALGRALTAAALIQRISLKVPSRLLVEVLGDGPLGRIVAEAGSDGALRGLVGEPHVPNPPDGTMRIAAAVGEGTLRVTREDETGRRYSSQVALVSGELGHDVAHFLEQSEQIRSAVLLGVLPRSDGIVAAGGLVVEALPGTADEVIASIERNVRLLDGVSAALEAGGVGGLVQNVLQGHDVEVLERLPMRYECTCRRRTLKERIATLAPEDLEELFEADGTCEAVCAFCGERYLFRADEIPVDPPPAAG